MQPSIIPFLTPMAVLERMNSNNDVGFKMFMAPVNHNKLDEKKTLQIINTILGNTYQHEDKLTRQNQDFGLDACVVVGYDDNNLKEKQPEHTVCMKVLHPEQPELNGTVYLGMFPKDITQLITHLQSNRFQKLLKTDATTVNGQEYVAEYFKVAEQWKNQKNTETLPSYFNLLKLVKQHSKEDHVWISFWEGMHRYVAIMLSLLCADITYDSTNCYIHRTLTTESLRRGDIKGFLNQKIPPEELIQDIFNGKRSDAPLFKSNITITVYIPTMTGEDIDTIMEVTQGQSQSVSDNKLSSAVQTLSTSLHDCLSICFTLVGSRMLIAESRRLDIQYKINVQQAITDQAYRKKI